jgi:hypothetical protein
MGEDHSVYRCQSPQRSNMVKKSSEIASIALDPGTSSPGKTPITFSLKVFTVFCTVVVALASMFTPPSLPPGAELEASGRVSVLEDEELSLEALEELEDKELELVLTEEALLLELEDALLKGASSVSRRLIQPASAG